jgi:hypothetical protein
MRVPWGVSIGSWLTVEMSLRTPSTPQTKIAMTRPAMAMVLSVAPRAVRIGQIFGLLDGCEVADGNAPIADHVRTSHHDLLRAVHKTTNCLKDNVEKPPGMTIIRNGRLRRSYDLVRLRASSSLLVWTWNSRKVWLLCCVPRFRCLRRAWSSRPGSRPVVTTSLRAIEAIHRVLVSRPLRERLSGE